MENTETKGTFSYRKELVKNQPKPQTSLLSTLSNGEYSFEVKEVGPTRDGDRDGAKLGLNEVTQNVWVGIDLLRFHGGDEIKACGKFKITNGIMSHFAYTVA